jgi:hypothetical protein
MANQIAVDKDGYILDGRFAGRHVSTVVAYAESLENAGGSEPAKPPQAKPDPQEALEAHASGRVDAAQQLTALRLEQDDEIAFKEKVGPDETKKYLDQIKTVLKQMPVAQRVTRDIHWAIYVQLKSREPDFSGFAAAKPAEPPPPAEPPAESEEPPVEQPPAEEPKAPVRQPKAAPPTVPPTPASRSAAPKERKPKLQPNEKIRAAAREWGIPVESYLLQLEDRGITQNDIERQSAPKEDQRRKSVFDRHTAH